jgi:hypothetical protein
LIHFLDSSVGIVVPYWSDAKRRSKNVALGPICM